MSDFLKSLIHLYKNLDESKQLLEDVIDEIGVDQAKTISSLPQDIQYLVEVALDLTPEQRKSLMRFIESLKQE